MIEPEISAFERASALNNGRAVPCPDRATAAEVTRLAGPGRPIRVTVEPCTGRCRCAPTIVLERAQRWDKSK